MFILKYRSIYHIGRSNSSVIEKIIVFNVTTIYSDKRSNFIF